MDLTLAFKAHTDTERNVSCVLVLSVLNRRHFDYCTDFHTDSVTVFAYLKKPVGRLVNWHQSRYGRAHHIILCASSGQRRWNGVHDVSLSHQSGLHTTSACTYCTFLKVINSDIEGGSKDADCASPNENVHILQWGRILFEEKHLKGKSKA